MTCPSVVHVLKDGSAPVSVTATKSRDDCEGVPSIFMNPTVENKTCYNNSTRTSCIFVVTEVGTYTVTATLANVLSSCNITVSSEYMHYYTNLNIYIFLHSLTERSILRP